MADFETTGPTTGPCDFTWGITRSDVAACCAGLADEYDTDLMDQSIRFAVQILYRLTGRQYTGPCVVEHLRPCHGNGGGCGCEGWNAAAPWSGWWWNSTLGGWGSMWPGMITADTLLCGVCSNRCELPSVDLPGPIQSVEQVVINGEIIDPATYEVWNYATLRRISGGHWPCSNDRHLSSAAGDGNQGTWEVSFTRGTDVDPVAKMMGALYACQVNLSLCNNQSCQLPYGVTSIVREQTSIAFAPPNQWLNIGLTGLPFVDQWIKSVNPNGNQRRARAQRLGRRVGEQSRTWPA